MTASLPLFQHDELNALRKRRETLLKRVQRRRKHSPGRYELIGQLKAVTAQILLLERELLGRSR